MRASFTKLDRAFNPEVLAIVGDSGDLRWIIGSSDFKGRRYSVQVNPRTIEQIEKMGVKNYTSLHDIPEPVDLVIVAVGRKYALQILEDCIEKGVAAAHFYTAGFTETDTEEGAELERTLSGRAEEAGFHLVGPNCMGLFVPTVGLKQNVSQYVDTTGPVGFISQSGTHAINFSREAHLQGIDISKSVSFGNGCVLDSAEYLEYFGNDNSIRAIGMYLEGVRNGRRFLEVMRDVSARKPVVVWKGGRTESGSRAVTSHTGSLAIPQGIWDSAMKQYGAVPVSGMEELIDTLKALLYLKPVSGKRVVLAGGSGGQSVATTDAFTEAGLEVPELSQDSYDEFGKFFDIIGGSYRNPIDTGNPNSTRMEHIMSIVEHDANTDNIVLLMNAGSIDPRGLAVRRAEECESIIRLRERTSKPVMVCISVPFLPRIVGEARETIKQLQDGGVPAFISLERGAVALKNTLDYYRSRR